jgi:HAD superfamily hydrolase (TIGR01450 family)
LTLPPALAEGGQLLDRYEGFAIDLDGVVWRGEHFLDGAIDGLKAVQSTGKPFILLTNNGSYGPDEVVKRLGEAGIDLKPEQVLTSAIVGKRWLVEHDLTGATAFILGPPSVVDQFAGVVKVVSVKMGAQAEVVVVGRDIDLTYDRLSAAADAIRAGAVFIALNWDPVMPVEGGGMVLGTGAVVAALEAATGHRATVMGKPETPMMQAGSALLGTDKVLMIGDRIEADIAGARRAGWDAALVLTGLTEADHVVDPIPDFVFPSLGALALKPPS